MAFFQMVCHHHGVGCCDKSGSFAFGHLFFADSQICPSADISTHRRRFQNRKGISNSLDYLIIFLNKMTKENIIYIANLGNGIFICDKSRRQYGYYMAVAHIDYHRNLKYYEELPGHAKVEIEKMASFGNMATSVANPEKYALRPLNSFKNDIRTYPSTNNTGFYSRNGR